MKLHFAGGAREVGASCILLEVCGKRILLDSGIRQSGSRDPLPDFRTIQERGGIDAVIISHAHLDHTGSLPLLSREYPGARIYLNKITAGLIRVLLYDSLKIMNYREGEIPLYSESDVEQMLKRMFIINYENEFRLFDDITLTFSPAGHIAGASLVTLKSGEGVFFYSGDFSFFSQKTVEGARMTKLRCHTAVIEATYGDKLHANRELEEERMVSLIEECTAAGGKILIPSFALGRAQEIILIIRKAKNKNRLTDVPVYVDGMIKDINRIYNDNPQFLKANLGRKILKGHNPFYDKTIRPVTDKTERNNLLASAAPAVIIASSGMLSGGYSQLYVEHLAPVEKNAVIFSGYQDEESPGRLLLGLLEKEKAERKLCFDQKVIPVACRVEKIGLSAHGDKSEIKNLVNILNPQNLFLVHGEDNIIRGLGAELAEEFRGNLYLPSCGDAYDLEPDAAAKIKIKGLHFRMQETEILNIKNIHKLWEFILEHYPRRFFITEEFICLWTGKRAAGRQLTTHFQRLIGESVYFESDSKRLFLFRAKSRERVAEDSNVVGYQKQNEIEVATRKYFEVYHYRKAGYLIEDKKVLLYFDFPAALPDTIREVMTAFREETGWQIEVYKETNINAAEFFLRQLLPGAVIKKFSYFAPENKVVAILTSVCNITDEQVRFKEKTGLALEIQIYGAPGEGAAENPYNNANAVMQFEGSGNERMEQNAAFQLIDAAFREETARPYKKGLKTDHKGKYIELAFISPLVGKRYGTLIARLAEETGWRIIISKSFNQNAICLLASTLCTENGLVQLKNPSFNMASSAVILKVQSVPGNGAVHPDAIYKRFEEETGCVLKLEFEG